MEGWKMISQKERHKSTLTSTSSVVQIFYSIYRKLILITCVTSTAGVSAVSATWVTAIAATRVSTVAVTSSDSIAYLFVGNFWFVSTVVSDVLHNLTSAVGKQDEILALGNISLARLLVAEVVSRGTVLDVVLEVVIGGFLKRMNWARHAKTWRRDGNWVTLWESMNN